MFRFRTLLFPLLSLYLLSPLGLTGSLLMAQSSPSNTGSIVKTMNASGYTYLHLDTGSTMLWVAIPETPVKEGETISFLNGMVMENFYAKTLDTTFPSIIFSPGLEAPTDAGSGAPAHSSSSTRSFADAVKAESDSHGIPPLPAETSGGSAGAIVPFVEIVVEKAAGETSFTVGEIFGGAEELDGKMVQVRGKVVKFTPDIMGKNWIHLQDGSGDPMKNTHDLVVTTLEQVAMGEIVTFEGQISAGKDFGFGYKYDVLVEDAEILK